MKSVQASRFAGASQQNWLLMSEMGQKRTLPPCFRMAALPLIADLIAEVLEVRLVPKADIYR
jgi:hypothetical protein